MSLDELIIKGNKLNSLAYAFVNGIITLKNNPLINKTENENELKELMIKGAELIYDAIKLQTYGPDGYSPMSLELLTKATEIVDGLNKYFISIKPENASNQQINKAIKLLDDNKSFIIGAKFTDTDPFNSICIYKKNNEYYVKDNSCAFLGPYKISDKDLNEYLTINNDWAIVTLE